MVRIAEGVKGVRHNDGRTSIYVETAAEFERARHECIVGGCAVVDHGTWFEVTDPQTGNVADVFCDAFGVALTTE